MTRETFELVLNAIKKFRFRTVDITGGAPELNPSFRDFVAAARSFGSHVIVRHNLTVMFEPGQIDLPEFFREQKLEIVSSLPYFLEQQTDAQRGRGVFQKSIKALRRLNAVGYGVANGDLILNLVYNQLALFYRLRKPQLKLILDVKCRPAMASRLIVPTRSRIYLSNAS